MRRLNVKKPPKNPETVTLPRLVPARCLQKRQRHNRLVEEPRVPRMRQQKEAGGNEKNANLAVEILHLASMMRDQGERPALTVEGRGEDGSLSGGGRVGGSEGGIKWK